MTPLQSIHDAAVLVERAIAAGILKIHIEGPETKPVVHFSHRHGSEKVIHEDSREGWNQ